MKIFLVIVIVLVIVTKISMHVDMGGSNKNNTDHSIADCFSCSIGVVQRPSIGH